MKKLLKFAIVLGVLGIIAGGALFVVGMTALEWDFKALDREDLTEQTFASEQEIDAVTLEGNWSYVILRGESFKIEYYESDLCNYDIGVSASGGGKYAFRLKETRKSWLSYLGFASDIKRRDLTVTVTVAEDCALTVNGSSARITAKNQDFKNIAMEGSDARLTLENVGAANITARGSSCRAELKNITANDILIWGSDARANLTDITANDITAQGSSCRANITGAEARDIKALGSDIHVNLYTVSARNVSGDSSSCGLTLQNSEIAERISIQGSNARLTLNNSSAKDVYAKGSDVRVTSENADIRTFDGQGSSLRATLNLKGAKSDIKHATASGSSANVYLDGERSKTGFTNLGGDGFKTFTAIGSSVRLYVNMKGGESVFKE